MKASDNPFPSLLIEEATEPSAPAAGYQRLYIDSVSHKLKRTDSSGTDVTIENAIAETLIDAKGDLIVGSAADTAARLAVAANGASLIAASGETTGLKWQLNKLDATAAPGVGDDSADGYSVGSIWIDVSGDDAYICVDASAGAAVWNPFEGAGAGGPLLYMDSIALHADGDNFTGTALTGWTVTGASAAAVTTEVYDATCLDLTFPTHKDRLVKAITVSDNIEISLTCYGMTNSTPAPATAVAAMIGLFFADDNGDGTACSLYTNGDVYIWTLDNWGYSASGSAIQTFLPAATFPIKASECPFQLKLKKVGTTLTCSASRDALYWKTVTRTDNTTPTKMGIIRAYTGGGTNPVLRVGRFNVVEL